MYFPLWLIEKVASNNLRSYVDKQNLQLTHHTEYKSIKFSLILTAMIGTAYVMCFDTVSVRYLAAFPIARRIGHPYQNRTPPKRKKPRTSFTRIQVAELEKRFHKQKYLASAERAALARGLKMTDAQVKTWFQNRRTKWRRKILKNALGIFDDNLATTSNA
ncbi:hypothetical protein GQX74_006844 [Glossina fuscipes]|nr:hypothetical protein GQX74_006844 [Glossina fuscipes]